MPAAAADLERALAIARKLQGYKPYSSPTGRTLAALQRLQSARGPTDQARRSAELVAEQLGRALCAEHPEAKQALTPTLTRSTP